MTGTIGCSKADSTEIDGEVHPRMDRVELLYLVGTLRQPSTQSGISAHWMVGPTISR
jgi:hypothetical protein